MTKSGGIVEFEALANDFFCVILISWEF